MSSPKKNKQADYYQDIYDLVRLIPFGRVTTYGSIARYLGNNLNPRIVGWAMNASHRLSPPIPAHRVVNRLGVLTGKHHFGDPNFMQQALEKEGIIIIDDQIQSFETIFWNPETELDF